MKTYTVTLVEDTNGDLVLPLPQAVLDEMMWVQGDVLSLNCTDTGTINITRTGLAGHTVDDLLLALLGSHEFVDAWWNSPNAHFGFQCPVDCDQRTVYNYVLENSNL